jgi:UDP:flavonoid glycosyltransferase YjiC (YdhE family)
MIPVIDRYISGGSSVILGGSGKSGELLKEAFPLLPFLEVPSVEIKYKGKGMFPFMSLLWQLPAMIVSVYKEHQHIKKIVSQYPVDIIISDNRYGLYCKKVHCIFVTHQISPVLPLMFKWAEYFLYRILRTAIHKYNECWIPDFSGADNLTGNLSHRFRLPHNARFIGILSRFTKIFPSDALDPGYKLVIILSGPQPQLRDFTQSIIEQTGRLKCKALIITGLQHGIPSYSRQISVVPHLGIAEFKNALLHADVIVCRAGYSGIMDLFALGKSAVLVPTPGQTEQLYLAEYLSGKGSFNYVSQSQLDLNKIMEEPLLQHKNGDHYPKTQ